MKLYVVVDYENDFVDGVLGFPGAEVLDEGIVARGREVQAEGGLIVEVRDTHRENYLDTREGKALAVLHAVFGTHGWEIYGKTGEWLKTVDDRITLLKSTFGIDPTSMSTILPDDVDEIEIVGLVTNMCVISVAVCMQARYPEAQIYIHKDLVASFDPELQQKALDVMAGMQMKII